MATKAELEKKIEKYDATIKGGYVSGAILDSIKAKKSAAEKELAELGETAPAAPASASKAKGKASGKRPAGVKNKTKKEKPTAVVNKQARTVTVDGVEYSKDKCDELLEAWDAQVERGRKAGKEFAKKSSGEVIGDKLVSTGEKVLSSIKKTDVEKKPTFYRDKLERLSKVMMELADLIDDLVGKDDASDEVKGLVKQIQAYITKNLSKK